MLVSRIYRHVAQGLTQVSTKKIRLDAETELYFQITAEQNAIVAFLESCIVEICAGGKIRSESNEIFFTKLLESLNRNLTSQEANAVRSKLRAFIAIVKEGGISFSVCNGYQAYLMQWQKIVNIADGMWNGRPEFSFVSTGVLTAKDWLYISNRDLLGFLTQEDLAEIAEDPDPEIIENLISREAPDEVVDCLVFVQSETLEDTEYVFSERFNRSGASFLDTAFTYARKSYDYIVGIVASLQLQSKLDAFMQNEKIQSFLAKKEARAGLFGTGVLVAVILLTLIIRSLFYTSIENTIPEEYKTKLIEAEQILARSSRDIANKELFKENVAKAEALIFAVRDQKIFANDVKNLLDQISVLKRQLNWIESYSLESHPLDFEIPADLEAMELFENAKRLFVVWKTGIAGPYIKGSDAKVTTFPDKEEAISADITPEWVIYVLTKTNRVIRFAKGEFTYVNVEGQNNWQPSSKIRTFIGNIYLLAEDGTQIFRHRPSVSGFTAKSPLITGELSKNPFILDFSLENWFYVLRSDLNVEKFFTAPEFSRKGIIINKLPDNYRIEWVDSPKIASSPNANYLYMELDDRVWIFEPDSRSFKDIRAIQYVGQIEIPGQSIHSYIVPKDGEIRLVTDRGISTVKFEVSDGKINIR